ncbi:hypothetical protein BGX28_005006 [Mortierella sp. GBA30]|nr:hypothetical protein BGX28_005006 [Mortierella sp. GBA30]
MATQVEYPIMEQPSAIIGSPVYQDSCGPEHTFDDPDEQLPQENDAEVQEGEEVADDQQEESSSATEIQTVPFTRPAEILPQVDLDAELRAIKNRLEALAHPNLQIEIMQLSTESKLMEQQWIIIKDVYHREYVVAAAVAAAAAAAKAKAELKG